MTQKKKKMATSIEETDSVSGAVGHKTNCSNCKETGITKASRSFCHSCDLALCETCERLHRKLASSHEIEFNDEVPEVNKEQSTVLCSVHKRQAAVLFCQDHESLICTVCQDGDHSACSVQTITEACDKIEVSKEISEALDKLMKTQEEAEKLRHIKQLKLAQCNAQIDDRRQAITSLRRKFSIMFDKYETQLISKGTAILNSLTSSIRNIGSLYDRVNAQFKCLEDKFENIDKDASFQQLIIAKRVNKKLNEEIAEIREKTIPYDITIKEDTELPVFLDELSKLVHQEVTDSEEAPDEENENKATKSFLKIKSFTAIKETNIRVRSDKAAPWITGCCWLPDGDVIVCDYESKNKTLKILDKDMNVKFTATCTSDPYDVDFIDENSAIVTLPCTKEIQFIGIKPGFKFKEKKDLKLSCYGVCIHNKSIFVCVDAPPVKGVKVMTLAGDDVTFITHLGPGGPRKLCLNSDGKIYYTGGSRNDLFVNCVTKDGYGIFSVSSKALDYPAGIANDAEGNVLVCDKNKKCVQVISSSGVCGDVVLTEKDILYGPCAICINRSYDVLAVACWNSSDPNFDTSKLVFYKLKYA